MINYTLIGKQISYHRKKNNLTQAKLAEMLNLSICYMSQIETGKRKISLERLENIAECLNISVSSLLSHEVDVPNTAYNITISELISDWSHNEIDFLLELILLINEKKLKSVD